MKTPGENDEDKRVPLDRKDTWFCDKFLRINK